jgi:hypothetical protein
MPIRSAWTRSPLRLSMTEDRRQLGPQAAMTDSDGFDEAVSPYRLENDGGGAGLKRFACVAVGRGPAVEHERHLGGGASEYAYQIDAATVGEPVVDDGDIGTVFEDRRFAVSHGPDGGEDLQARVVHKVAQEVAKQRVVLDQADRRHRRGGVKSRYGSHDTIIRDRRAFVSEPKDLTPTAMSPSVGSTRRPQLQLVTPGPHCARDASKVITLPSTRPHSWDAQRSFPQSRRRSH